MWKRYVAIGDSTTEGLDDPDGRGGFRGWANRFAEAIAASQQEPLLYANLAVRGLTARQILDGQLEAALAMRPDVATAVAGVNDLLRPRFDADSVAADIEQMLGRLRESGAVVLTFTMPDLSSVMPIARLVRGRLLALNERLRASCRRTGALLVDLAAFPMATDPRMWSDDRLHASSLGHARIGAALSAALGLPGADDRWTEPLPSAATPARRSVLRAELAWAKNHLLPWVVRRARGRSSSDGRGPKRPLLTAVKPG